MILFPLGRVWMLNRDGSKWKHVKSAVENCKVQKYVELCAILNFYKILMKGKSYVDFESMHLYIHEILHCVQDETFENIIKLPPLQSKMPK